jgi:predicted nucleotidyltransferase
MSDLRMLADEVGVNERTLRRAANEGTLKVLRPTPRSWRVPPREKQYVRQAWPLLAALRGALRTEPNVRFALLFGSAARGEDTAGSDVDLLVQMLDPSLERITDLELKLEDLVGRRLDLITLETARDNPLLLATAADEGRVLVDRDGLWPELSAKASAFRQRARKRSRRQARAALAGIDELLAE